MGIEILEISDRLLAACANGIYQGILLTALVALSFRLFGRINAATRHAVWLCALVLLVLLVVAHFFFHSRPLAPQPDNIARAGATLENDTPKVTDVAHATDGVLTETGVSASLSRGDFPAAREQLLAGGGAGDPPGGMVAMPAGENSAIFRSFPVPSGGSPDGTGGSPVLPTATTSRSLATAIEPVREPTASEQSAWFHSTIRRLADPVSLTLGLESRGARIVGAILLSVCLLLSAARLFMLLLRLRQIRKLKLQSLPASEALNGLFRRLVTRHGTGRKVVLKTLPGSPSSFVLGFLRPVILLPAEPMDPTPTEQILRHELAHVRQRDDWANLIQHFILAAFPFHPAVWWISRRLSLEREIACDDYVLQSSAQPHAYALLLANLAARMQRYPPLLAPGASNNKTQLQQRIDMILNTRRNTSPRLAATWLTFLASAAALSAVAAICLAPRIVLAQSATAPAAANAQGSLIDEPIQASPAIASVAVSFSPEAGAAASSDAAPATPPRPAGIGQGPKVKPGGSWAISGQPAVAPAPPTPSGLVAPAVALAPVIAQSAPPMAPGPMLLSAAPAPEPRPGRTPRPARAESADSSLEERLERLEKMVESLMARGYAPQYPFHVKPSPDTVAPMHPKEMAELEARLKADIGRKHELNEREIDRIKEHAKRDTARAAEQVKRAAEAEQKRQTRRGFKEGSQKQLDELHKRLESLEREREKLEHQIEELERNQEQLENEEQDNNAQSDASESNPDSKESTRQ